MSDNIKNSQTAATLWRLVVRNANTVIKLSESSDGIAFYCVHPIFGDVSSFRDLARSLGSNQCFYGIQVPKEKMNAAFPTSIEAVARHHVAELLAFQPQGPLVLGGWSAGAIIALEMAQQLRAIGRNVLLLIAFDGAPCNTGAGIKWWNPLYIWKLFCNFPGWIKWEIRQNQTVYGFVQQLIKKTCYRVRIKLPALKSEQTLHGSAVQNLLEKSQHLNNQMNFIRALYNAMRLYVAKPYPGRVLVYEAKTQPLDHLLQVAAAWKSIAKSVEVVQLQGNHNSIFREPAIRIVASHICIRLAELLAAEQMNRRLCE